MFVTGTGIPAGAYVESVTSDTAFELSASTTGGSVTDGTLTFFATDNQVITCVADGDEVCAYSSTDGIDADWITHLGTTDDTTVCQIYYASGNGLYVADANFAHGNASKAKIYVYREDQNETISGWKEGNPLIASPLSDNEADAVASKVNIEASDNAAANDGSMNVCIVPSGTGRWDGE